MFLFTVFSCCNRILMMREGYFRSTNGSIVACNGFALFYFIGPMFRALLIELTGRQAWDMLGPSLASKSQDSQGYPILGQGWPKNSVLAGFATCVFDICRLAYRDPNSIFCGTSTLPMCHISCVFLLCTCLLSLMYEVILNTIWNPVNFAQRSRTVIELGNECTQININKNIK